MGRDYRSKRDAEAVHNEAVEKMSQVFCPLTRKLCMVDKCMSFQKGGAYRRTRKLLKVVDPSCINPHVIRL